jgi:hypothetical protein
MSQMTYDLLAVWAILSVPATIVLGLALRLQSKEIARLRKQVTFHAETRHAETRDPSMPPAADDPTSEHSALELEGQEPDLDDTHQFRALAAGEHVRSEDGEPAADPPRSVRYEPKTVSVFEKLRSHRSSQSRT